jgi:hypothetical protein
VFLEGIEMEQQMVLPEGGLASFLTSNLDEIDDSRLAFGRQNGINSMRETAERMAQLGRNGDDVLIHATKKERLIPKEVSEANPELMTQVDIAIADAGADPSAYIVGSETNSVNPYTGQREFFLKKIISGVKKVFKAVAPIVVPFALNFIAPGLGSIASGFIGSGITGLVQGKSFKDSLKMGLQGALIGGISSGIQGVMAKDAKGSMIQKFGQGVKQGALPDLSDGASSMFRFGPARTYNVDAANTAISRGNTPIADKFSSTFYNAPVEANPGMNLAAAKTEVLAQFPELAKDSKAIANLALQRVGAGATDAIPGSVKLIPTAATILAGGAAVGAFDPIDPAKVEDPYSKESASERRLRLNRNKYASGPNLPQENLTLQDIMVSSVPQLYDQYLNPQRVAAGGEMDSFPRRTGYIEGPGTETSDDIPAMLSDGEFVMNAKAVRGAGGGSREKGVRRMYDMMRAFEGGAVA